jgi:hypothetical protein
VLAHVLDGVIRLSIGHTFGLEGADPVNGGPFAGRINSEYLNGFPAVVDSKESTFPITVVADSDTVRAKFTGIGRARA